jgi:VWFA-related protein
VDLVAIDVAVVDRNGRPVEDLRAPDFAVKIDGEVRRVVSAELIKVDVEAAKRQVADKSETFYTSNLTPPNGRQIVLAVDQINIRPGSLRPIMAAAQRFLDRLSPLDQIAFITFPEPGPRVSFTNDKLRLKLAMQGLIGQQPRTTAGQYNIGVSEALAIEEKRDQLTLAAVMNRECRSTEAQQRAQCERDIISESSQISRNVKEDADQSLIGLRNILERLAYIDGPKSLILISEGLAVSDTSELRSIVQLAGMARTSINVMLVDLQRGDVTIAEQPPTELQDRRIQVTGLEALATMSRGSLFPHCGNRRAASSTGWRPEISAMYILGRGAAAERQQGRAPPHRRRGPASERHRSIASGVCDVAHVQGQAYAEDNLREALSSPFPVSVFPCA